MDKIVFVIGATKSGGAEKRAIFLSKLLKDSYETKVFAFHGENDGDVDLVYMPTYEAYKQTRKSQRINQLRNYLLKEKPNFVISFVPHINFFTTKAVKGMDTLHIVGIVFPFFKFPSSYLLRYSLKKADAVYYQCEEQKLYLKCRCFNFVLPNPIDVLPLRENLYSHKMMSVGRLEPQKDFPLLINAFKKISESIKDAALDIYGLGSEKENLITLIKQLGLDNKVQIYDYIDNIAEEYKKHDIFLFSSKAEGFPNALAEAMANNLICFSTSFKTGCNELLINNQTGFVCETRDSVAFGNMIAEKLNDYGNCLNVSKNGYEHIKSLCDINKFKDEFIKNLTELKNGKTK